ncbi:MAG: hypothetical protein AB7O97_15630 [Planctomycetota bacterium]
MRLAVWIVALVAAVAVAWSVSGRDGPSLPATESLDAAGRSEAEFVPATAAGAPGVPATDPSEPEDAARLRANVAEDLLADFPEPERSAAREILAGHPRAVVDARSPFGTALRRLTGATLLRAQVTGFGPDRGAALSRDAVPDWMLSARQRLSFSLEDSRLSAEIKGRHGCAGPPRLVLGSVQTLLIVGGLTHCCVLASPPVVGEEPWASRPQAGADAFPPALRPAVADLLASYVDQADAVGRRVLEFLYMGPMGAAVVEAEVGEVDQEFVELTYRSDAAEIGVYAGQRESVPWKSHLLDVHRKTHGLEADAGLRPGTVQVVLLVSSRVRAGGMERGVVLAALPTPR